ncbi:ChrR family anti-sigma-E factor [Vibrio makurazakiensis]|uniref:ChrR family anti-sigma-E factor n=1 Tax=Vibrio makurazakiensis TaxID=2910250 RepID=UPI003D0A3655
MIKHHPSRALLEEFVSGNMVASVSVIISSHIEMCSECKALADELTLIAAQKEFDTDDTFFTENTDHDEFGEVDLSGIENATEQDESFSKSLIESIMTQPVDQEDTLPTTVTEIDVSGTRISLPRAIKSIALKEWQGLGKVSRARLNLDDGERRTSLLHIAKGGHVPSHTHNGFEITLLIQGSFEDEMGTYEAGDFIWLDSEHTHTPVTQEGCVCLTVSSDALHFTQGVSQLFNPLGKLIY